MIRLLVLCLLAMAPALVPPSASGRVFDLTVDFQPAVNPDGPWSYRGWANGNSFSSGSYLLSWQPDTFRSGGPGFGGYPGPAVFQFPNSSVVFSWPSFYGGLAIVFTMPFDSAVSVAASSTISGGNPSISLDFAVNGVLIGGTGTPSSQTWAYDSQGIVLTAGSQIYLQQGSAGCCGQYTYNSFIVTLQDIPEPHAGLMLFSFLLAVGVAIARGRERSQIVRRSD